MIQIGDVPLRPVQTTLLPPGIEYIKEWTPTPDEEEEALQAPLRLTEAGIPVSPMERPSFWGGMSPKLPWELRREQANAKGSVQIPTAGDNPGARDRGMSVLPNSSGSPDERDAQAQAQTQQKKPDISQYAHLTGLATPDERAGTYERASDEKRDVQTPYGTWIRAYYSDLGRFDWKFVPKASMPNTVGGVGGYPRYYYGGGGGGGYSYDAPAKPWYMEMMTWRI